MNDLFWGPGYVSPFLLIDSIPALARNEVPLPLQNQVRGLSIDAWNLLEDAVFFGFRMILGRSTIQLGKEVLFSHEPEGIVLEEETPEPCAILYECKSRSKGYKISSDDQLRYKDYIKTKRHWIKARHKLSLRHFVIVGPQFNGHCDKQIGKIEREGVKVSLVEASLLRSLFISAAQMSKEQTALIDLRNILESGIVSQGNVDRELERVKV